jgi:hypothetical protein
MRHIEGLFTTSDGAPQASTLKQGGQSSSAAHVARLAHKGRRRAARVPVGEFTMGCPCSGTAYHMAWPAFEIAQEFKQAVRSCKVR